MNLSRNLVVTCSPLPAIQGTFDILIFDRHLLHPVLCWDSKKKKKFKLEIYIYVLTITDTHRDMDTLKLLISVRAEFL